MFDLLADLLALYYSLWNSYGFAIILFTLTVMMVLTPLTFHTTRSMLRMQSLQPKVKKLQTQFQGDRQAMNEEVMRLYRENKVNPLGSCLPLIMQLPVFFVLFRLIRGLTRRVSDLGVNAGWRLPFGENNAVPSPDFPERTFNPEYLADNSDLREALERSTEMNFLGMDLSASLTDAFRDSFATALPFVLLVVLIGVTSYVQQRQIAGRRDPDAPVNPQQQMIMKFMPWFLPVISVGFPAGLNLYFVSSNIVRVGQQSVITRRIYKPHKERQALVSTDEDDDDDDDPPPDREPDRPVTRRAPRETMNHGQRRPTSRTPPRSRPDTRRATVKETNAKSTNSAPKPSASKSNANKSNAGKSNANKSNGSKPSANSSARESSRVTQQGQKSHPTDRRRQRKKRRK